MDTSLYNNIQDACRRLEALQNKLNDCHTQQDYQEATEEFIFLRNKISEYTTRLANLGIDEYKKYVPLLTNTKNSILKLQAYLIAEKTRISECIKTLEKQQHANTAYNKIKMMLNKE